MWRTHAWVVVVGGTSLACGRPSPPANPACCDKTGLADAAVEVADASPFCCTSRKPLADAGMLDEDGPTSFRQKRIGERFVSAEGCARDLRIKGALDKNLAELGKLCAQGMAPGSDPVRGSVPAGGSVDAFVQLSAPEPACLRVAAVATAGGLTIVLEDPDGEILASVRSSEAMGVLPIDGPFCVRRKGAYRAVVRSSPRAADETGLAIQVWASGRDR